ncbi:hypothetical protein GCM10007388_33670 [Pseudoduganella plicata]|uniref:Uncharacterized protein n=1 Tax=Pseudoduganella plicata TaxID=321984 RepID=A0AA87Y4P0_9BURK|nr:hypothetical protein GCM10007388_33670 [Pseudoduganella plicata]
MDARDIGEIAAVELLRRDAAGADLPVEHLDLAGPDPLTGNDAAAIWTEALRRPIAYGGDDTAAFERNLRHAMPAWMAYDMRLMAERFQGDGMVAGPGAAGRLVALLGRPLRSCRAFVADAVAA